MTDVDIEKIDRIWRTILPDAADRYGDAATAMDATYSDGGSVCGEAHILSEVDTAWLAAAGGELGAADVLSRMQAILLDTADRARAAMRSYGQTDHERSAGLEAVPAPDADARGRGAP